MKNVREILRDSDLFKEDYIIENADHYNWEDFSYFFDISKYSESFFKRFGHKIDFYALNEWSNPNDFFMINFKEKIREEECFIRCFYGDPNDRTIYHTECESNLIQKLKDLLYKHKDIYEKQVFELNYPYTLIEVKENINELDKDNLINNYNISDECKQFLIKQEKNTISNIINRTSTMLTSDILNEYRDEINEMLNHENERERRRFRDRFSELLPLDIDTIREFPELYQNSSLIHNLGSNLHQYIEYKHLYKNPEIHSEYHQDDFIANGGIKNAEVIALELFKLNYNN